MNLCLSVSFRVIGPDRQTHWEGQRGYGTILYKSTETGEMFILIIMLHQKELRGKIF